jgi:hypothetical protein
MNGDNDFISQLWPPILFGAILVVWGLLLSFALMPLAWAKKKVVRARARK